MAALRLDHVRKSFGGLQAVNGLSLEVNPGEILGFLGPNGAGKSTTINMAVGLLAPDEGRIDVGDAGAPTQPEARRRLGVAPQSLALYGELSAAANLRFFGSLYGLSRSEQRTRATELLEFAGLLDRQHVRVETFSGGMKRRLNLAAALVHRPELVLLDEPTVGVDPQSRNAVFEMVERLRSDGCAVVYTTHYMEEAQRLCDRVAVIDHGQLLALDTVDNLVRAHGGRSLVTVRRSSGEEQVQSDDPARDLERLMHSGDVLEVRIERPSLEAVFLNLTGRSLRE